MPPVAGIVGVANFLACYAAQQIEGDKLNAIVDLAFNYPEFAIAAKRANDRDLPLWLIAVFFAASVLLDRIASAIIPRIAKIPTMNCVVRLAYMNPCFSPPRLLLRLPPMLSRPKIA